MTAYLTVVSDDSCLACRSCDPLIRKVSLKYPDVTVLRMNADDPYVRRYQARNLVKNVRSIEDKSLRDYYLSQGLTEISGLPTIFITSDRRPLVVFDMLIGCVGLDSEYPAKERMMKDIEKMFRKALLMDAKSSLTGVGRFEKRSVDYGIR